MTRFSSLCAAAVTVSVVACVFAQAPATQNANAPDASAPWGVESSGIAIRIFAAGGCCQGEPMDVFLEVKNVSKEKKYLAEVFDPMYPKIFTVAVTGPSGQKFEAAVYSGYTFAADTFKPIEPNEVWRMCFANLGSHLTSQNKATRLYGPGFSEPGKYTAQCAYMGTALPEAGKGVTDEMKAGNWLGKAVSNEITFTVHKPTKEDLRVHEWGVFTVYADVAYANAAEKAEWASLPDSFYHQFPTRKLRFVPTFARKPIVYFYSGCPAMEVKARVRFAEGAPVVWWPAVQYPFDGGGSFRTLPANPTANASEVFDYLEWNGWLGRKVPGGRAWSGHRPPAEAAYDKVTEANLPADCWVNQARIPGPLPITVVGGDMGESGMGPWASETERFLFYDGLVKAGDGLRLVARDANGVTVENTAKFDLGDLFLFDLAEANTPAVGFAALHTLKAGAKETVALAPLPAADFAAKARGEVKKALLATGLYGPEANSILTIWDKGFFAHTGLTAMYLLPQAEYDRMLPLEVKPPPGEVLRVGIVLCPRLEAAAHVAALAAELLKKLGSDNFKVRDEATKGLVDLGPAVIPQVEALQKAATSAEVQTRCRDILDTLDAAQWLKAAEAKTKKGQGTESGS